jgi:hypothetical protein
MMIPFPERVVGGLHIDLQCAVAQVVGGHGPTISITRANEMFSSWSPSAAFVAGVNSGSANLLASTRPGRQGDAADLSGRLVVQQPRAGQVAARHAFHRKHLEPAHHQRAAQHLVRDARVVGRPGQVVGRVD